MAALSESLVFPVGFFPGSQTLFGNQEKSGNQLQAAGSLSAFFSR